MKKKEIITEIQTVFDSFITSLQNTDDKELNEIPFQNSWTIGQVADHIVLCSESIFDSKTKEAGRSYDENAVELRAIFTDMEQKSEAAAAVYPKVPPHNKQELIDKIRANKIQLLTIAEEKDLSLLALDMEFPYLGYLTRYEWLTFICVHTQRHLNQLNNIKKSLAVQADIL